MARVVVLGGGIAGHTAALHLSRMLKRSDEVVVVTPNSKWNWIPSNIWVGVGKMKTDQVTFELGPIYKRKGIGYEQALATAIHPEGDAAHDSPYVEVTYTDPARSGEHGELDLRLPDQRHRPEAQLRGHPGPGPRRPLLLGVHLGPCRRGVGGPAGVDRQDEAGRAPDPRRRHGTRDVHVRGRRLRVRLQRRARGAPGRRARPGRHRLPDQRVRAGRLRGRWADLHPAGVPDHLQAVDRVALPRAGDPGHHRGPRDRRRGGRRPLRAAGRYRQLAGLRLRHAAPALPRGGPEGVRPGRWRTSAPSSSPPTGS